MEMNIFPGHLLPRSSVRPEPERPKLSEVAGWGYNISIIPGLFLPRSSIRPEPERPKLSAVTDWSYNIPIVELGCDDTTVKIKQIGDACREYGFFEDVSHGDPKEILQVVHELFTLPVEEKMKLYSDGPSRTIPLSTSFNGKTGSVNNWRDYLRLHCYPLEKNMPETSLSQASRELNICSLALRQHVAEITRRDELSHLFFGGTPPRPDFTTVNRVARCPAIRRFSISCSGDNQQQLFVDVTELSSRNLGHMYGNLLGSIDSGYVPQVSIGIPNGDDRIDISTGNGHIDPVIYASWKEYRDQLKNSKFDDDRIKMISGTITAVAGQVVGGMMVNRLTSSAASSFPWAVPVVELATVFGLSVTLAGISLRGKSRSLSTLMIKIGAITTAAAIIFSMGMHLPPAMAGTVGLVAFLIIAVAVALA